jgi:3-oxoacyl-[acyl-carrier protein] reductase
MLSGKVAFITGASAGIGAAVARSLSAEGVKLGLASRRGADLGLPEAAGLTCDVRELAQVEAAVDETVDRFGGIDIVVANAGVGSYHRFGEEPLEHIEEMIDVNLKGTIYAIRAALPHLERSEAADVITLASEAGRRGIPGEAVYCASKFGQVGLMMTAEDVAEVVLFVLTRPRGMRILEAAFRPMKEASWG